MNHTRLEMTHQFQFYTATYVQDKVDADNQYCYGDGIKLVNKTELTGPAEIGWEKCCMAILTTDEGVELSENWKSKFTSGPLSVYFRLIEYFREKNDSKNENIRLDK